MSVGWLSGVRSAYREYSSFMASAPDAFALYDSELNLLDVNQALLKYWPEGKTKEDLIGRNMLDLDPDLKETGRYDRYIELIKTGIPFQIDDYTLRLVFGSARLSHEGLQGR